MKPNILFMFADQMHGFAMNCMGTEDIHTPHLDELARSGALFRNAYSNAPVCTPFRINLMSGRYGAQTDALRNEAKIPNGTRTLADCLNDGGYRTSYVGKWHNGATGNVFIPPELRGGFQEFIGYQCYNDYLKNIRFFDEVGNVDQREGHRTDITSDIAIERLDRLAQRDEPFALFVSYQNPHYPEQPSPEYAAMYEGKAIRRRPNCQEIDPFVGTASPPSPRPFGKDPNFQRYGNNLDQYLRDYYAMVTQLDANVGRMLHELEKRGLRDNTVIVFTSDHGDLQGSHGLKNKGRPWEESTRIPLIVDLPQGAEGVVLDELVSGIDIAATLVDLAGEETPGSFEGASFAPLARGEPQQWDRPVFSELRNWAMVRHGDLKLTAGKPEDGARGDLEPQTLFDLGRDPYEMDNVLDDPNYTDERERLSRLLREWWEHVSKA